MTWGCGSARNGTDLASSQQLLPQRKQTCWSRWRPYNLQAESLTVIAAAVPVSEESLVMKDQCSWENFKHLQHGHRSRVSLPKKTGFFNAAAGKPNFPQPLQELRKPFPYWPKNWQLKTIQNSQRMLDSQNPKSSLEADKGCSWHHQYESQGWPQWHSFTGNHVAPPSTPLLLLERKLC